MSHDVARLIYKIAKEDDSLYSDDLKKMYVKRIKESKSDVRNMVYNAIVGYMKKKPQPIFTTE